jgi:DNA-binding LytR/AlgR family response regulator
VKAFDNPETFLKEIEFLEFDLCIMDIEMPGINGLYIADKINKPVIFTTAYKDYALEAFDLNAIDYVQKPVQKERLEIAIKKAIQRIGIVQPKKEFISLNSDKGRVLIYFDQLQYVTISESDSRDKIAFLENGAKFTLKNISFEKLLQELPADSFCRVNKKDLIAVRIVQHFTFDEITTSIQLSTGKTLQLSLSEVYRSEFLKKTRG